MNKLKYFFILVLAILGVIGTIGWLIYCDAWAILVGALAVDYLAYKPFVENFKKLIN